MAQIKRCHRDSCHKPFIQHTGITMHGIGYCSLRCYVLALKEATEKAVIPIVKMHRHD